MNSKAATTKNDSIIPGGDLADELPLWSSNFAWMLLEKINFKKNINILDVGCGTGFLSIELAQRFGNDCKVTALDIDPIMIDRLKQKTDFLNIENIDPVVANAEDMPFDKQSFDLIISNNGANNADDFEAVIGEVGRVSKRGAQFLLCQNTRRTFIEFYEQFEKAVKEIGKPEIISSIKSHINDKRRNRDSIYETLINVGFNVKNIYTDTFFYRFADGTSMMDYHLIKHFFRKSWDKLVPEEDRTNVYALVEKNLNKKAERLGEVILSVPYFCFESKKVLAF